MNRLTVRVVDVDRGVGVISFFGRLGGGGGGGRVGNERGSGHRLSYRSFQSLHTHTLLRGKPAFLLEFLNSYTD